MSASADPDGDPAPTTPGSNTIDPAAPPGRDDPHRVLGLGVVGAGFIAESHALAAAAHPGVRLASVYDRAAGAAGALAGRYGATVAPSLEALLADPAVDVVVLGTPNDTHRALALQTAAAGKHLLLEKPLTLTAADAAEVVKAFQAAGTVLLVGHTHRHSDYARAVKAAIARGAIGEPRSMRLTIAGGWIWGNWGAWVLDPVRSGGHAFHNGVHLYDLARWWLDSEIESVYTLGQRVTAGALQIDDALTTTLTTKAGSVAVCEISRGERPKNTSIFEIVIHGSRGSLVRRWNSDGTVLLADDGCGPVPAPGFSPFLRQLDVLHAAVTGAGEVFPSPADAVHAIAVAEAASASAGSGDIVAVADPPLTDPAPADPTAATAATAGPTAPPAAQTQGANR